MEPIHITGIWADLILSCFLIGLLRVVANTCWLTKKAVKWVMQKYSAALKRFGWRLTLVLYALVLPIYYVWVAVKELWEEDSLPKVYCLWWKSFKKGGKL